jgi:MFS family permease
METHSVSTPPRTAVRRLALARGISATGSEAAYVALMVVVFRATGSTMWLAMSLLLTWGVTGLVAPFTAILGDRLPRRRVMIASDLAGAVCFGAMAFLHEPVFLLAVAFSAVVVESPFWSASAAAIPNVAEEEHLGWANGLVSMGRNLGHVVGPALGGLLVSAIGASWVFSLNAISFAFSAALVASVHATFDSARTEDELEEHRGSLAGIVFVLREPVLRTITLAWIVFVLGLGMAVVADLPLAESFDAGSFGFGLIATAWGLGSVVGALAGRWLNERNEIPVLVIANAAIAVMCVGIWLSPWFALILALMLGFGVFDGVTIVADTSILQRRSPDAVRSRTIAARDGMVNLVMAGAFLVGGAILPAVGAQGVYGLAAVSVGLATFVLLPLLRRLPAPTMVRLEPGASHALTGESPVGEHETRGRR